jgi:subtilisin family serine protease
MAGEGNFRALNLVKLPWLMDFSSGKPGVAIGLIDGPVALQHPALNRANIVELSGTQAANCSIANSAACTHGTFVAGVLNARRGSDAPALCPGCTLLVRPVFAEGSADSVPAARSEELAAGIFDVIQSGARIINLSLASMEPASYGRDELMQALDFAARRRVMVIAAAGNQSAPCGSAISSHPWVIPAAAYAPDGALMRLSAFGNSIGRRGIGAPGEAISLQAAEGYVQLSGTSVAAPFVAGTAALLWSCFPDADALAIRQAILGASRARALIPPLLDAAQAYARLSNQFRAVSPLEEVNGGQTN